MLNRSGKLVLYASFFILVTRIIFDLQHIQGDRYSFLNEVEIAIQYDTLEAQKNYSVWRSTIDNKETELTDKRVDSIQSVITYLNVPRVTFIKAIYLETNNLQADGISSLRVKIGKQITTYSKLQFLRSWAKAESPKNKVRWIMPFIETANISRLPLINSIINWRGDNVLVTYIFRHNLSYLSFIILFIILSIRRFNLNKYFQNYGKSRLLIIIIFIFGILKNTFNIWALEANLDPSFVAGLAWANNMKLQWGNDFIFTYGPYFWLTLPSIILNDHKLLLSLILNIALTSASLFIFYYFILSSYVKNIINYTTFLCFLLILLIFHYDFLDYVVVSILVLIYQSGIDTIQDDARQKSYYQQFITVLLALLSLIKFSYIAFSISLLIILSGIYLYSKRLKAIVVIWTSYAIWFIAFWFISGQAINNIRSYLVNGFEVASGYTEAMSKPFWNDSAGLSINLVSVFFFSSRLRSTLFIIFSYHNELHQN